MIKRWETIKGNLLRKTQLPVVSDRVHIMVDLETMGTDPATAPIVSIGAVAFTQTGIVENFYRGVSLKSTLQSGAVIEAATVLWWLGENKVAQDALLDAQHEGVPIRQALEDFMQFVGTYGDRLSGVWGNGATFDNAILHASGKRCGVPMWQFWNDKCYRTAKGLRPDIKMVREGVHHHALDDARSQAHHLIAINRSVRGIL